MKYLAQLNGTTVVNTVVAEDDAPESARMVAYSSGNPAHIGGDYVDGYFYPAQPFPSWTRNLGTWVPPTPSPTDGKRYSWDEDTLSWVQVA